MGYRTEKISKEDTQMHNIYFKGFHLLTHQELLLLNKTIQKLKIEIETIKKTQKETTLL